MIRETINRREVDKGLRNELRATWKLVKEMSRDTHADDWQVALITLFHSRLINRSSPRPPSLRVLISFREGGSRVVARSRVNGRAADTRDPNLYRRTVELFLRRPPLHLLDR